MAALTDGELGTPDFRDPQWAAFPPGKDKVEVVIDLGKPVEVSSVAIDMLINHEAAAHLPTRAMVSVSQDGVDYEYFGSGKAAISFDKHALQQNLDKSFKPRAILILVERQAKSARFVKVTIIPSADVRLMLDEVMVNPVASRTMRPARLAPPP